MLSNSNIFHSILFYLILFMLSSEVSGSLRPNGHKNPELREWEENILLHLNNVNLMERDDRKTSYVKFKLFKRDI